MSIENEAKIQVAELPLLRERLEALGAEHLGGEFERNWVFDLPGGVLHRAGILLRVRNTGGAGCLITVKGPEEAGEFKRREEVECGADSTEAVLRQFELLGYEKVWLYEKRRDNWRWRGCALALDECPELGNFLEIEGEAGAIKLVAADLRVDVGGHLRDSYFGLWRKYLLARGEEGLRDMKFPEVWDYGDKMFNYAKPPHN